MPFNRPTLSTIITRIKQDLESRLTTGAAVLRRAVIKVFSIAIGGAIHSLYGFIDFMTRQLFVDTAEEAYLARHGNIWGVSQKPATFAQGPVIFTGINGTVIIAGTELQRSDGIIFETDSEVTISGGTATADVTCQTAGSTGNTEAGVLLTLVVPIPGIESAVEVDTAGITDGVDLEDVELWRARILNRIQTPPLGGAEADYVRWALEVPGVTRAWAYSLYLGPGTVGVTFVVDGEMDIIPDAGKVQEVQDYIDALRPVTAEVTVFAPIEVELDFEIELDPDTTPVRAAVQAELEDMIMRDSEPGGTILISRINEAISIASGELDHVLVDPVANVTSNPGELLTMGTITWS